MMKNQNNTNARRTPHGVSALANDYFIAETTRTLTALAGPLCRLFLKCVFVRPYAGSTAFCRNTRRRRGRGGDAKNRDETAHQAFGQARARERRLHQPV